MRTNVERELKLDVDAGFVLPELGGEELPPRSFVSTYHDTPDHSLARAGITLRRRVEDGTSLWQLKLPRSDGARSELEEPGGDDGPPERLAQLLAALLRHRGLRPVASLHTQRSGVRVHDDSRRIADVTVDDVEVVEGDGAANAFVELEVELLDGDQADLERIGRALRHAGARRSSERSKLGRALELPRRPAPPAPEAPLLEHLRHLLEVQLQELEASDPGVRLGEDPEAVHRFRVATRRARALIRETRLALGDGLAPLAGELSWLTRSLGPVRDLDVLLDHLRAEVAQLGPDEREGHELLQGLDAEREHARLALIEALDSSRYTQLLDDFERALAQLSSLDVGVPADVPAREAFRRVRRAVAKLPDDPTDEVLHALRIRAKRARYAAELATLALGKPAARVVEALKRVQDVIGEHQDAVVAEERLRRAAHAGTRIAAGRLIERERRRRLQAREAARPALTEALAAGRKAFSL
jgi:CHAD domain-containing protein